MYRSSFIITNSTFINNIAAVHGGVISTVLFESSIINSTFTNNSAADVGGVVYCSEGSFNIASSRFNWKLHEGDCNAHHYLLYIHKLLIVYLIII